MSKRRRPTRKVAPLYGGPTDIYAHWAEQTNRVFGDKRFRITAYEVRSLLDLVQHFHRERNTCEQKLQALGAAHEDLRRAVREGFFK